MARDGNGDAGLKRRRERDRNESSRGDLNWDKDGNGNGNDDEIMEGGGETNERKELHKTCRRDHPFSFRTRHQLCRQGVVLARTRQLPSQGAASVHAHRTKGVIRCVGREDANGVRSGIRVGGGNGDGNRGGSGNGNVNVDGKGDGAGTNTGGEPTRKRKM